MKHDVNILTDVGTLVPARSWIKELPPEQQKQLLRFIEKLEQAGLLSMSLVVDDGPGRYKVQIRDESNRLKTFTLQLADAPETILPDDFYKTRNQLVFYGEDYDQWILPYSPWTGRPGEEVFIRPPELDATLEDIRLGRQTADYKKRPDGIYQIRIERNGTPAIRILGIAVWR